MVTLLTSPSCTSCRKAKGWLEEHDIPFQERNIFSEPLSVQEVKDIVRMTEDGTDEIVSKRSKIFQELNVDVDTLPLQQLFELISEHPGCLDVQLFLMKSVYKLVTMKRKFAAFYRDKFGRISYKKHKSSLIDNGKTSTLMAEVFLHFLLPN